MAMSRFDDETSSCYVFCFFFFKLYGDHRDLHRVDRRQRQMCIRDSCTGAADGYARMLQKPAMAILHLGPGLANGIANLHNARRARSMMVNVVGEHTTWHLASDPQLAMDIESLAKTVSGWHRTCNSAKRFAEHMANAVNAAKQGQIATLIVPFDLQKEKNVEAAVVPDSRGKQSIHYEEIKSAAALLKKDKKAALFFSHNHIGRDALMAAARIKQACGCDLLTDNFPAHIERGAGLPDVMRIPYLPEMAMDMLSKYEVFVFIGSKEPVSFFMGPSIVRREETNPRPPSAPNF